MIVVILRQHRGESALTVFYVSGADLMSQEMISRPSEAVRNSGEVAESKKCRGFRRPGWLSQIKRRQPHRHGDELAACADIYI